MAGIGHMAARQNDRVSSLVVIEIQRIKISVYIQEKTVIDTYSINFLT
jgi:hypothetical protein